MTDNTLCELDENPVRTKVARPGISKSLSIQVFRRDHWLCRWCGCPVIFHPAMRYLAEFLKQQGFEGAPAYYQTNWHRRDAPLLDLMGAVVDHVKAHSGGGASVISNLVTACNKCNGRKNNLGVEVFTKRHPLIPVKSKYGAPTDWDGLSAIFLVLIAKNSGLGTPTERRWEQALMQPPLEPATE